MAVVIAVSCRALPVQAQIRDWVNTSNTFAWYDRSANWNPAGAPSSGGTARFGQPGTYQVWWDNGTASLTPSVGFLQVQAGNVTFRNLDASPQHQLTINGSGGLGFSSDLSVLDGSDLTLRGIHLRSLGGARVFNSSLTLDGLHSAGTRMSVEGQLFEVTGSANVLDGGVLNSMWTVLATGNASVRGAGSQWNIGNQLEVGAGEGFTLRVREGGRVTSVSGGIGRFQSSTSTVLVSGAGSQWNNTGALIIGGTGTGILDIEDDGLVTVGGTTSVSSASSVNLNGGRFEFGTMSLASMNRISGSSGSLAGNVLHAGYTNVASMTTLQNSNLEMTEVNLVNSGGLYGNAVLGSGLRNTASGEVETVGNERMRFAGGGTNAGQINVFGGQVRFGGGFVNEENGEVNNFGNSFVADSVNNLYGGMISGRGQFVAMGGWSNQGVMAFSQGVTDIHGDVYNQEGAAIVTSGDGTTNFYGDFAQENGGELRTSAGSATVFFGEVSGGGSYTGAGTVFMEGDLRPGNSPGSMSFGGDLVMSSTASLLMELGGLNSGDFDQLFVGGDLLLDNSQLDVALWDGFALSNDMQFLIADVNGGLFGQFAGLGEGSLVGNFGGTDLFITYNGFGGNGGVGLFTSAIPEPSALALVGIAAVLGVASRRRRNS